MSIRTLISAFFVLFLVNLASGQLPRFKRFYSEIEGYKKDYLVKETGYGYDISFRSDFIINTILSNLKLDRKGEIISYNTLFTYENENFDFIQTKDKNYLFYEIACIDSINLTLRDSLGQTIWVKHTPLNLTDQNSPIDIVKAIEYGGNFYFIGQSYPDISPNIYAFKIDQNGELVWSSLGSIDQNITLYDLKCNNYYLYLSWQNECCDAFGSQVSKISLSDGTWMPDGSTYGLAFIKDFIPTENNEIVSIGSRFIDFMFNTSLYGNAVVQDSSFNVLWNKAGWPELNSLVDFENSGQYAINNIVISNKSYLIFGQLLPDNQHFYRNFIARLDFNGNIIDLNPDLKNNFSSITTMTPSSDGGCIIVARVPTSINNNPDSDLCEIYRIDSNLVLTPNLIQGTITHDSNENCEKDSLEQNLRNRFVRIIYQQDTSYQIVNNINGYEIGADTGQYKLTVQSFNPYWGACETTKTLNFPLENDTLQANFDLQANIDCPQLEVNVFTPRLRRCFDNNIYINYCNNGTIPAENTQIKVVLPSYLDFISSQIPVNQQIGDTLFYDVGSVGIDECKQFSLVAKVNCDNTALGQTLCIEAFITPDTLCVGAPAWSGAEVRTQAVCEADSVVLTIQNIGNAPTGTLDYVIIEDVVIWRESTFNLGAGEILEIKVPANGSTWRIEAMQPAGFPQSNLSIAFIEGCGWNGPMPFPGGFITQFPDEDGIPTQNTACQVVTGSYDPNDKNGFPSGVGTAHNILPNTPIEYLIRFQNTGTDTAFKVVIRDILSKNLDLLTVQMGASSHPCRMEWLDNEALVFTFDNIGLPQKAVNEPASNGFVKFTIQPKADLPLGTSIQNEGLIYFDFNQPIHTNVTLHTINVDFLDKIDGTDNFDWKKEHYPKISPNPVNSGTICQISNLNLSINSLLLMDVNGNILHNLSVKNGTFKLPENLVAGVYFWSIDSKKRGKLVVF
jgi:uncharacterized repeat protein (TIGR01451 family)